MTNNSFKNKFNIFIKLRDKWQSNDEDFDNIYWAALYFFLLDFVCLFFTYIYSRGERDIFTNTFIVVLIYFMASFTMMAISFLLIGFYIKNNIKHMKDKLKNICFILFCIPILITGVILIPLLFVLTISSYIISLRAKTFNNFMYLCLYIALFLVLLFIFFPCNIIAACYIQNYVNIIFNTCHIICDEFTSFFAILLLTIWIGLYLFNKIYIICVNRKEKKKYKKLYKTMCIKNNNIQKNEKYYQIHVQSDDDFDRYYDISISKRADIINRKILTETEDNFKDKLDYTKKYLKNSRKIIWLASMILIFIFSSFKISTIGNNEFSNILDTYQSDINNVITIYTLFLLIIDKSKEIKK